MYGTGTDVSKLIKSSDQTTNTHPEIVHVASKEDFWELEQLVFFILHIDVEIELEIPARPHILNLIIPFVHEIESANSDFFTEIAAPTPKYQVPVPESQQFEYQGKGKKELEICWLF